MVEPRLKKTGSLMKAPKLGMRHYHGMGTLLVGDGTSARSRGHVRGARGFDLVVGLSAATILVGAAYTVVPIWAAPEAWERASGPFQTVFTAMLALTGPAVGLFMASVRRSST